MTEQNDEALLIANAKQLGLTAAQAQKLSDSYSTLDGNLSCDVQSVSLPYVKAELLKIAKALEYILGGG